MGKGVERLDNPVRPVILVKLWCMWNPSRVVGWWLMSLKCEGTKRKDIGRVSVSRTSAVGWKIIKRKRKGWKKVLVR